MRGGTILIGKTFSTIPATDDPTVAETFAKDGSPHDTVVPMRIDPDRGESLKGELHDKMQYAFPAAIARDAVYRGIWTVIRPFPVVDDTVSGVITGPENKSGDDSAPGLHDIAVGTADVLQKKFPARIILRPLVRIAGRNHETAGMGEYFHQPRKVFRLRFADGDALLPERLDSLHGQLFTSIPPHGRRDPVPPLPQISHKSGLIALSRLPEHPAHGFLEQIMHPPLRGQHDVGNLKALLELSPADESKGAYNSDTLLPDGFPIPGQVEKQRPVLVHKPGTQKLVAAQIHKVPVVDVRSVREIKVNAFLLAGRILS